MSALVRTLSIRERWQMLVLALLALLAALAEALGIGAVFPLLNLLTQREAALSDSRAEAVFVWSGATSFESFILLATTALMLLFVLKNLLLSVVYYAQARFVCDTESRIATELLTAYLSAPYVERIEHNSADRVRVITGEVSRVTVGFLLPLIHLTAEALVIIALIALLLAVQPIAALLAVSLVGTVTIVAQAGFRKRLNHQRHVRVAANSAMFRAVSEGLGALKETKVLGQESHFIGRLFDSSRLYAGATVSFMTMNLLPRLFIETAAVAALAGCVALTILTRQPLESVVPVLTIFGLAAVRIMPSATRMLGAANNLRYYAPSVLEVATHVTAARELPREELRAAERIEAVSSVELRGVSYRYPGAQSMTLNDVTLSVRLGEIVAITGRSGAGKTTIADIVLGLITPTTGDVVVNDRKVTNPRRDFGLFAGLVPQNFFILDDNVRRNIAFGIPDFQIDDSRVWQALELASMAERVRNDPRGLDMPAGENGALLSGGERQRLAIARALYHAPGLLVFDEATSALDASTEIEVVATIEGLARSKAVLVITHRPAFLRVATRVLTLEKGTLADADGWTRGSATTGDRAQHAG